MNTSSILNIKKLLSTFKKVVIIPHKNPDGYAMGSTLGLCLYLKKKGHSATVIAPNDYPEFLKWLPGNSEVINYEMKKSISKKIISLSGENYFIDCSNKDLAGVITAIKNSDFFIGNNSGPLNLASALGVKTITLMADTPLIYGSYSSNMYPILPDGETTVAHDTLGKDKINPEKIFDKFVSLIN